MPPITPVTPRRQDVEALHLALEALDLKSNSVLFVYPETPAEAAYARQLLDLIINDLERAGRIDVIAVVSHRRTPIEAVDEVQMRRGGWLRVEKVQGLTRKAKRLRDTYRQYQDATRARMTVDHMGVLRAIEELATAVDVLFPDEGAEVVR